MLCACACRWTHLHIWRSTSVSSHKSRVHTCLMSPHLPCTNQHVSNVTTLAVYQPARVWCHHTCRVPTSTLIHSPPTKCLYLLHALSSPPNIATLLVNGVSFLNSAIRAASPARLRFRNTSVQWLAILPVAPRSSFLYWLKASVPVDRIARCAVALLSLTVVTI